ncbi:Protease Do-like 7 [Linum grandiflorum]
MTTSGDHMADGADRQLDPAVDGNGRDDQEATEAEEWREVINKVAAAVVVIRTTACRSFDTELLGSDSATGFVVDKQRGIILTNRHVVKPGPVVAQATFLNQEEIPIHPLYRDPVHDFGFFWYDPSALQFMKYEAIPLVPEIACVGLEIRVVGNDSGDKLSISAGTIARLDQDAPDYGGDGYNDFNTFYIQAASGTKGGSSGSPVIERQGRAVALNAGARTTSSTAFFLPLQRVARALRLLQEGNESHSTTKWNSVCIPRGTLQTTFQYKGFNEVHRLGVKKEIEQIIRHASPDETGMLVVDTVVPNGPAYEHLEPGDVLLSLNGKISTNFLTLDSILDDHVEQIVELQIERGDKTLSMHIMVQNLNSITPDHFLEVSGAVIHPLSYQQARNFLFPCGIVYVSDPGYILERAGVPRCAIIKKLANVETPTIKEFIAILHKLPKGARVSLEYITSNHRHKTRLALITIDHHEWYGSPKIYTRDDCSGLWNIVPVTSLYKDDYGETIDPTLLSNGLDHGGVEQENDSSDDHHLADNNGTNPFSVRTMIEPSLVLCEVGLILEN